MEDRERSAHKYNKLKFATWGLKFHSPEKSGHKLGSFEKLQKLKWNNILVESAENDMLLKSILYSN